MTIQLKLAVAEAVLVNPHVVLNATEIPVPKYAGGLPLANEYPPDEFAGIKIGVAAGVTAPSGGTVVELNISKHPDAVVVATATEYALPELFFIT